MERYGRERTFEWERLKNDVQGDTEINYSLGGFPAPGAGPQFTSVLPNLIPFSWMTWLVLFTDAGILDPFSVFRKDSAVPAQACRVFMGLVASYQVSDTSMKQNNFS